MTIFTKGDLIQEFSKYCEDIAATLDVLVEDIDAKADGGVKDGVIVDVLEAGIPDLSVWWDESNKKNFIDQMDFLFLNDKKYFDAMITDGSLQLGDNPKHVEAYGAAQKTATDQKLNRFYYERLLPHPVGIDDMEYGAELRETKGFKTLEFMTDAAECSSQINMMINPEIDDLKAAFRLCVDISTYDGTSILSKISNAKTHGLFLNPVSGMN